MSFFFYGRPAYRVAGDGTIKVEAACPTCLLFKPTLIHDANAIYAFDTGAFGKRMYKHILFDEMQIEDFSLEKDSSRPNKLIKNVFGEREIYFDANTSRTSRAHDSVECWDFHAKAYLDLIGSSGRNEPDDRICTIEVVFSGDVKIHGNLMAVVVPHTLWSKTKKAPWLQEIHQSDVEIVPFEFVPNRHPEHYNALMEGVVKKYYKRRNIL